MQKNNMETEQGMERYDSPPIPHKIVPGLMVHLKDEDEKGGISAKHFGFVEHMEGEDFIKLSGTDSHDGECHWMPLSWVKSADENALFLYVTEKEFYDGLLDKSPYEVKDSSSGSVH